MGKRFPNVVFLVWIRSFLRTSYPFFFSFMEPAKRVLSNHSTKSYLERELIVSLDNDGPMIGPTLETLETTDENTVTVHQEPPKKEKRWWKSNDTTDPRQYSRLKKNIILFIIAIAGSM